MRRSEVESKFLASFTQMHPQFQFRGLRRFPGRTHGAVSLALRLVLEGDGREIDLLCAPLTEGTPENVQRAIHQLLKTPDLAPNDDTPLTVQVLVAPYVGQQAQALCRQAGIGFFDLAGNAWLAASGLYVDILGRRNASPRRREVHQPYEGKAERVVRRLLLCPDEVWKTRDLAESAGVSVGLVSMATTALAREQLVSKSRAGIRMTQPKRLLDNWSQAYDLGRSAMRTFRSLEDGPALTERLERQAERLGERYALTLWSGASALLAGHEPAAHLALYWQGDPGELAGALQLSESIGRNYAFVFTPYDESLLWETRASRDGLRVVSPLQLYLDLASGDESELALAGKVRQRLIRLGEAL